MRINENPLRMEWIQRVKKVDTLVGWQESLQDKEKGLANS